MSTERLGRVRLIVVTALVTSVATLAVAATVLTWVSRRPPPTPRLAPPKTITVTLYPVSEWGRKGFPHAEIPATDFDNVIRLVTPDKYVSGGVHDRIDPLIAEVVIAHDGHPDTRLLVRWAGKNPAMISVDGRHYFYGVPHEGIHDGGMQLVALVERLVEAKTR